MNSFKNSLEKPGQKITQTSQFTGSNHRCRAQFKGAQTDVDQRFAGNGPNGLSYHTTTTATITTICAGSCNPVSRGAVASTLYVFTRINVDSLSTLHVKCVLAAELPVQQTRPLFRSHDIQVSLHSIHVEVASLACKTIYNWPDELQHYLLTNHIFIIVRNYILIYFGAYRVTPYPQDPAKR